LQGGALLLTKWIFAALLLAAAGACAGSTPARGMVGARCTSDWACKDMCSRDKQLGGMCTTTCDDDTDCPPGSVCIERGGGLCALRCDKDAECAESGKDFGCGPAVHRGASGDVSVCKLKPAP
jgi:hypothetical protein